MKINGYDLPNSNLVSSDQASNKKNSLQDIAQFSSKIKEVPVIPAGFLENLEKTKQVLLQSSSAISLHKLSPKRVFDILSQSSKRFTGFMEGIVENFQREILKESNLSAVQSSYKNPKISFLKDLLPKDGEKKLDESL